MRQGHGMVDLFVGADWLALDYTPWLVLRVGSPETLRTFDGRCRLTLDGLVDRWLEELAWWRSQPQQLKTTIGEEHCPPSAETRWARFLASYNETTRSLSTRCFEGGDWCGWARSG